jgi:hypothetical protein
MGWATKLQEATSGGPARGPDNGSKSNSLSQVARRSLAVDEASPLRCWPEGQQLCTLYTIAARVWLLVGVIQFQVVSRPEKAHSAKWLGG